MIARPRTFHLAAVAALSVVVLALAPIALAGKGGGTAGGGGGGGKKPPAAAAGTGSISGIVLLDATADGSPHWNHAISFQVSSTAQYYFVRVTCSQNGTVVYDKSNGFYSGWLWGTSYGLSGPAWTGGAASCVATLYSQNLDGSNQQTEATLSFGVGA